MEGCVDERQASQAYASKQECMETLDTMARRKGVKFKCRAEPQWVLKETRRLEGAKRYATTQAR